MSDLVLPTAGERDHDLLWTMLGTMSGPVPSAERHQPANLLRSEDQAILVDCGDGATDQLCKAGVPIGAATTVIISHLHADHTAGLYGLLARRRQAIIPSDLSIYGPPGIRQAVEAIQVGLGHLTGLSVGKDRDLSLPRAAVTVTEIADGSKFSLGPVTVTTASNSHYSLPPGSPEAERFQSLSFRFDMPDRSLVYTGDTGPSENVEHLARGADLLVSEITDVDQVLAQLKAARNVPAAFEPSIRHHFAREHLEADQVGLLAQRSGVGAVVVTHNPLTDANMIKARAVIGSLFTGPVTFADDLDSF